MLEQIIRSRSRLIGSAVFALIVTTIFLICAAGSNAAVFSFMTPENESVFSAVRPVRAVEFERQRSVRPAPEPTCVQSPSGIVGWWPGNGNANDIINGNNGQRINGSVYAPGKAGQSFNFNQANQQLVEIPLSAVQLLNNSAGTITAWVNPSTIGEFDMVTAFGGGGPGEAVGFGIDNGNIRVYHQTEAFDWQTGIPVSINTWTFITYTWDETTERIYKNGSLVLSRPRNFNLVLAGYARIGYGFINDPSVFFNGQIDEVATFNRTLDAGEVAAIFAADSSGMCHPCTPQPPDMNNWWTGENNLYDIKGTAHGTAYDTGVTYMPGMVANGFGFDGSGYVEMEGTVGQFGSSEFTVDFWMNADTDPTNDAYLIGRSSPDHSTGWDIRYKGGQIKVIGVNGYVVNIQSDASVPVQTWHHIALSGTGSVVSLYIDGVLKGTSPRSAFSSTSPFGFGGRHTNLGGFSWFDGVLDEIEIFNRALSQTEIEAIVNAESAGKCRECAPVAANTVSWWPGENNAQDVIGTNNGTLVNGAGFSNGIVGKAFSFDGVNDYVEIPDSASLDVTRISMTFWFRLNELNRIHELVNKFGPQGSDTISYGAEIGTDNKVCFRVSTNGALSGLTDLCSTTTLTTGVWYHFAGTYDGSSMNLYINGANEGSVSKSGNIFVSAESLKLGTYGYHPWFLNGLLDEVDIAGRALSQAEIRAIYVAGNAGKCQTGCTEPPANLISWWPGENNAEDVSGSNFGVLVGGANFAPGIVGNAFSLNGSTATVKIPDNPTLDVSTQFTLGAWINPNVIPTYPQGALVISKVGPVSNLNGYQMAVANIGGTNKIWCGFNQGGNNWPQHTATGGNIPTGVWSYVACTYDHNTLAVHQNGQPVGSTVVGAVSVANSSSNLKIGSDDVGQQFYSGLIDEPMVFGRALSALELRSLFNAGALGVCRQLIGTSACAGRPVGTVSWWRAQDNALDLFKTHHGALLPGTGFVSGKSGAGFNFAGGGEGVDVGNWFNLQTFTIEMWVKPNVGQVQYANIVDNNHSSSPLRSWVLENLNNGTQWQWYSADFEVGSNILFDLAPGFWHHIVITRDANRVTRGYLNRSFIGSISTTANIPYDGTQNLRIGNWYGGNRAFNGVIDEVTIYNRALNDTELAALYNADTFGKCAAGQTTADFDGDMLTDLSIFRPAGATGTEWWLLRSSNGTNWAAQFGDPTDKIVAEDFTGDGKTDVAIFRPSNSNWYILRSEDYSYYSFPFGTNGDIAVPADYDGDGIADPTVYRPSTGVWYIAKSTGGLGQERFGFPTDKPVPADYDGDGRTDIAIYRPSNGQWWLNRTRDGLIVHTFGNAEDYPMPGDYTGDSSADVAIWRPSNGEWYVLRSEDYSYYSFPFGASGDIPAAGDYDGDGTFDAAVFRPLNRNWYLRRSTAGITIIGFGAADDIPVPGAFLR